MIVVLFVGGQESHESVLHLGETELAYTLPVLRMFVALIQVCFFVFLLFFFCCCFFFFFCIYALISLSGICV